MKLFPRPGQRLLLSLSLLAFAAVPVHSDEATRALQATLKSKGYYYSTPSGELDEDTHSAVRRFQIHEGLPINGEPDAPTAKALGFTAPPPIARTTTSIAEAPAVARGESAGPLQESDRQFAGWMEEEASPPRVIVRPTPESPMPPPAPSAPPAPPRRAPPAEAMAAANLPAEVAAFVGRYLRAGADANLEAEVSQYADAVDYFNNGRVNHEFIRRDTGSYRRRWPQRDYQLEGQPSVVNATGDGREFTVRFRIGYQVRAGGQSGSGRTESTMTIRRAPDGGFKIVAIKERQLPRE